MASPMVWALRDGVLVHIKGDDLVPGDRVRIEAGERIPPDGIVEGPGLMIDEAHRRVASRREGERAEVFSGTLVVRGTAFAPAWPIGRR